MTSGSFSWEDLEEFEEDFKANYATRKAVDQLTTKQATTKQAGRSSSTELPTEVLVTNETEKENENVPAKRGRPPGSGNKAMVFDPKDFVSTMREVFREGAVAQTEAINDANAKLFQDFPFMVEQGIAKEKGQLLEKISTLDANIAALESRLAEAEKSRPIEVRTEFAKVIIKGFVHNQFDALIKALQTTFPIMLVGSAGSGKTYAAEQCAEALGLAFYAQSVGSQTSQSNLVGYMSAHGEYISTQFRQAYEDGGVFVLDEIDAGNPNVLIILNSALASGFCPFPDTMVRKHENFKLVATANTYGTGASRKYVGRNQLDAATLDRFITMEWKIDEGLERQLVSHYPDGLRWQNVIKAVRDKVVQHAYEVVVSPRATMKGAQLLAAGYSFQDALESSLLGAVPANHAEILRQAAKNAW